MFLLSIFRVNLLATYVVKTASLAVTYLHLQIYHNVVNMLNKSTSTPDLMFNVIYGNCYILSTL